MELRVARRLLQMLTIVVLGAGLAACGADDGDEPDATSAPQGAQPTVSTTGTAEAALSPATIPGMTATSGATNVDMSTEGEAATPQGAAPGTATPAPVTPEPDLVDAISVALASPAADATPLAPDATGGSSGPAGTGVSQADEVVGDGTTGPALVAAATPSPADTPDAAPGAPQAGTPVAVTGCEVAGVPPFAGEPSLYVLTVDVNFRQGPGTDCDLLIDEPLGEAQRVQIIAGPVVREDGSQWVQIRFGDTEGWVSFEFLQPAE